MKFTCQLAVRCCTMLYQDLYSVRLKFIVTPVRLPKIRIWVQRACLRRCLRIYINSYSFERRESIFQDHSFTMAKQSLKTQVTSSDARMRTETGLCFLPSKIQIRNLGKRGSLATLHTVCSFGWLFLSFRRNSKDVKDSCSNFL